MAAYGRKEIAHFEQDTNNLLESFFNKQKYRLTLRKRRMKRLDDHLNLLVNRVMPSCFRDRRHKLEGVKIDPSIGENAKIEHQVSRLLHENMLWLTDPERGAGDALSFSDESIHYSFCLADLTCTCMNGSTNGCVHLEAASKLMETQFGGFQFKNLEKAASLIRSQNLMKKIETEFMNEDVHECINLSAWGFLVKRPPPASQMTLTNAHSGHCSCNMFSKADICPHLLALSRCICTFEENETFDPSIFRVKRRCSKKPILDIEPTMLGNTFERGISNENSTASERKYTTKAKSILGSISQYAKQVLPEYTAIFESDLRSVLDKLKNFYIGRFPSAWPDNQRMLEQNYSRKSTDNIHKALYPSASSSKKRSRLSLSQSCPNSSSR